MAMLWRLSVVHDFPVNCLANQSKTSCESSEGGTKVCINVQGHMTKMVAMVIKIKTLYNLLQDLKAYDFETWHEASSNGFLQSLYKS